MQSRRSFLRKSSLGLAAASLGVTGMAAKKRSYPIVAFAKPFQNLSFDDCADMVAEVGWDGIECPLRPKGQIEPQTAADKLPELVAALKKRGKQIHLAATGINSIRTPHAETALRAMAAAGIKRYRMAYWKYTNDKPIDKLHAEIRAELKDLVALNKELGLQAGYQNHSGSNYVGAPIWDMYTILKDFDPRQIGMIFDIGHATLEGGYSWPIEARLVQSHLSAVYVKDFKWGHTEKRGWRGNWCPLGQGMVNRKFFTQLRKSDYAGPISQHHEYELGNHREMVKTMRDDLKVLRDWLE
ncbi:MAG: sugar phosphate isomerase/epimerase [Limisphaerales bacterium]|jgi:sugar phosphate isomerase/epimerase